MATDAKTYFDETVIPRITTEYSDLSSEISIIVLGSVGLGIADELSDLEAAVYMDDALWNRRGGQLQLSLNKCLQETCPYRKKGSVLCVWPLSWLLGGHAKEFLDGVDSAPWEEVTVEDLFTIQNNLVVWDPRNLVRSLREASSPERMPERLWKKRLILNLKRLIWEDLGELRSCVTRGRIAEAHILFGFVLESLLHTAFLITKHYYPWRTHLWWMFEQLPSPVPEVLPHVDAALHSPNWEEKVAAIERTTSIYRQHISEVRILPEIDILSHDLNEELVWAERLKAWENPNWRDWIVRCKEEAVSSGYPDQEFWVWSLWGWVREKPNQGINTDNQ